MSDCKYTLRQLLQTIDDFSKVLDKSKNIDYWYRLTIKRYLMKVQNNIRGYLGMPEVRPKMQSFDDMVKEGIKFLK